jgi:hypothetical protein
MPGSMRAHGNEWDPWFEEHWGMLLLLIAGAVYLVIAWRSWRRVFGCVRRTPPTVFPPPVDPQPAPLPEARVTRGNSNTDRPMEPTR